MALRNHISWVASYVIRGWGERREAIREAIRQEEAAREEAAREVEAAVREVEVAARQADEAVLRMSNDLRNTERTIARLRQQRQRMRIQALGNLRVEHARFKGG